MTCPPDDVLRQLLGGGLTPEQAGVLESHLEDCTDCGERLAALTDTADTQRWRHLLQDHAADLQPQHIPKLQNATQPDIPGYEIIKPLGRGGVAMVYLARQISLNRLVALKFLRGGPVWDDTRRLRIEAESAAQLRHPNIVVVYEVGEAAGYAFLSMEYVDGGTLADLAARQPMAPRRAAELLEPVCRALQHAHQAGVIHRDVKPSNILLHTGDGGVTPKVADFGLARRLDQESGLTHTQDLLGTPVYMAPELVNDATKASPRSDVYAAGVVLYELLTGHPPFVGRSPLDTLLQARDREPVPPRRVQPEVPRDLQTICLKCLAKEPGSRYASAGELGDDLARFLRDEPVLARPVSGVEHAWRWARRHKALSTTLFVLALLLLAAMISSIFIARHFRSTASDMEHLAKEKETERGRAVRARESAELAREDALRTLYFTQASLTAQSLTRDDGPQVIDLFLREWRGRPLRPDPRGWEWKLFQSAADHSELTLHGHTVDALCVEWSADGKQIVSAGFDRTLRFWDAVTGRQLRTAKAGYGVVQLAWHPDGRRIIIALADGTCWLHDALTGDELAQVKQPDVIRAWNVSADRFLTTRGDKLILRDFDGKSLQEFNAHTEIIERATFAKDGRIASSDRSGRVIVWDSASGKPLWDYQHVARRNAVRTSPVLQWSPDGKTLSASFADGTAWLRDAVSGQTRYELDGHRGLIRCVRFSPDNRWMITCSDDRTAILWDLSTGRRHRTFIGHTQAVMSAAFHPDLTHLATASGNWNGVIKRWNLDDHSVPRQLVDSPLQVIASRNGSEILVATTNEFQLLDSQSGKCLRALPAIPPGSGSVADSQGRFVLGRDRTGTTTLRSADTGAVVATLPPIPLRGLQYALSPQAELIAVTTSNPNDPARRRILVVDAATGSVVKEFQGNAIAWSPDGRYFAVGGVYFVQLWDAKTQTLLQTWESADLSNALIRFSPDSQRLAYTAAADVFVRDVATGVQQGAVIHHSNAILAIEWNPDGTRIVTIVDDGLHLWDSASGQFILTLRDGKPMSTAAWSRDGETLWVGGAGGLRAWNAGLRTATDSTVSSVNLPLLGWWTTEATDDSSSMENPFTRQPGPEWFCSANDPNGFVPLSKRPLIYWTRVTITKPTRCKIVCDGPVQCQILHGGHGVVSANDMLILEPGTHTFGLKIIDPVRQAGVLIRPDAGLYLRIEPQLQ